VVVAVVDREGNDGVRLGRVDDGAVVGQDRSGLDVAGVVIGNGVEVVLAVDGAGEAEGLGRVRRGVGGVPAVAGDARGVGVQLDLVEAGVDAVLVGIAGGVGHGERRRR